MFGPSPWPSPDAQASEIETENLAALCRASADGTILTCNPAFVRLFAFASAADARERRLADLYPDRQWPALVARLRRERVLRQVPALAQRADGHPLPVVQTLVGAFTPDGELQGVTLLALDDTPRRTLETHLREVVRMETVGRLASAMAHDFSNLLMVINGLGESLLERQSPDDPLRPELVQLLDASHRAATLTSQLLAMSRKPTSHRTLIDLDGVVQDLKPLLERLLGPHVRLLLTIGAGTKAIAADRDQLEQVLLNLATNARDAMPQGGRLAVRTEAEAGEVRLTIADTGCGIPADLRARIFEPFFTTKPRGKGTGLGLWQVQTILAEHHGTIEVSSNSGSGGAGDSGDHHGGNADGNGTGGGSTFTIRLPLASPASASASGSSGHASSSSTSACAPAAGTATAVSEDTGACRTRSASSA